MLTTMPQQLTLHSISLCRTYRVKSEIEIILDISLGAENVRVVLITSDL